MMKHQSLICLIVGFAACGCWVPQHEFERATDVTRKQIDDADKREGARLDALEIAKSQLDAEISTIKGVGGVAAAAVTIALGFIGLRKPKGT